MKRSPKITKKYLDFLAKNQRADGSFISLSSPDPRNFQDAKIYHSVFPTALILHCVAPLANHRLAKKICSKATNFLLSQKSDNWSFNYWARQSKEYSMTPYPDDLDDTFCALSAIYQFNPKIIDPSALAKIITLLTATEAKEGGPYKTWLVGQDTKKEWSDIDIAINSNIAYFLKLQDVFLPGIISFVEKSIKSNRFSSPYYPSTIPVIYFISRWYAGREKDDLIKHIYSLRQKNGGWGSLLQTALSMSSLLNLGERPEKLKKSFDILLKNNPKALPAEAFCLDPAIDGAKYFAGSPHLTTAFCLEAITKFESCEQNTKAKNNPATKTIQNLSGQIISKAEKNYFDQIPKLKNQFSAFAQQLAKNNESGQIILLPYFFNMALKNKIPKNLADNLCIANLFGWVAHTIYDDFFDNSGRPELLPLANACLRNLSAIYSRLLPNNKNFSKIFHQTINKMDAANEWEMRHCRAKIKNSEIETQTLPNFKDYHHLADRSMGHSLGPIATLVSLGYSPSSKKIKNTVAFFRHYIIAKQLNDDAHDWEEDLQNGILTAVNSKILEKFNGKIHLKNDIQRAQHIYWDEIIPIVCRDILSQIKKARRIIKNLRFLENSAYLEKLLSEVEISANEAIEEREKTSQFLKEYENL